MNGNGDKHVCAKCGKTLDRVNWWTAGVSDRFGGQVFKLCKTCAMSMSFAVQEAVKEGSVANGDMNGAVDDCRELEERARLLESLLLDVWAAYSAEAESSFHPVWEVDGELEGRMEALGLLEGDRG